jgi:hypothetical protein
MPVEREFKAILKEPKRLLADYLAAGRPYAIIDQIYTRGGARMRRIRDVVGDRVSAPRHVFTYKEDLRDAEGVLEMEMSAAARDFDLATRLASRRLTKLRFKEFTPRGSWEIDFLLSKGEAYKPQPGTVPDFYFALAEYEAPEGETFELTETMRAEIDFIIPLTRNGMFSNFKLAGPAYAHTVVQRYLGYMETPEAEAEAAAEAQALAEAAE